MMEMSLDQIRKLGYEALFEKLGAVGTLRLQQFETGGGDYTREREKWLGDATVKDLIEEIRGKRRR